MSFNISNIKSYFKLKFIFVGILIVLIANYSTFLSYFSSTQTSSTSVSDTTTAKVEKADIKESIEVSGSAELVDEQSLKFNTTGTITKIYFKAGDSIKKGDIITEIYRK